MLVMDGVVRRGIPAAPEPDPQYGDLDSLISGMPTAHPEVTPVEKIEFQPIEVAEPTLPAFLITESWQAPSTKRPVLPIFAVTIASAVLAGTVLWGVSTINAAVVPLPANHQPALANLENQQLQTQLNQFIASHQTPFGIVVTNLKTGATASTASDQKFTSASLYKLFVARGILLRVDAGTLKLGDQAGNGLTIESCLNLMITVSDNACGETLGARLGWSKMDAELHEAGFKSTSLDKYNLSTSAGDVASLLSRLYSGKLLSSNSSQRFLDLLKAQKINDRLPTGLPAGTTIAHKTGDLDGLRHDAGIVYGPKTDYLIVALSGPWKTGNSSASFADLSRRFYYELNP